MLPIALAITLGALAVAIALTWVDFSRHQPQRPEPLIDPDDAPEAAYLYGAASLGVHQTAAELMRDLYPNEPGRVCPTCSMGPHDDPEDCAFLGYSVCAYPFN